VKKKRGVKEVISLEVGTFCGRRGRAKEEIDFFWGTVREWGGAVGRKFKRENELKNDVTRGKKRLRKREENWEPITFIS